jgi:hypothetical protein
MNVHLLVNELCEYQNARCNDKNSQVCNVLGWLAVQTG